MDPVILTYILFFGGGVFRPVSQYGLARIADAQPFNVRYLVGQVAGVLIGFLALVVFGNLPDVVEIVDRANVPDFLYYVVAFGVGYFFASMGRQGDKVGSLVKSGSYKIPSK